MNKPYCVATILTGSLLFNVPVLGDEYVSGYVRKDGTYVAPHFRSSPNSLKFDNYSSQGRINPYTGAPGSQRNEFSDIYIPPPRPQYNDYIDQDLPK